MSPALIGQDVFDRLREEDRPATLEEADVLASHLICDTNCGICAAAGIAIQDLIARVREIGG